MSSTSNRCCMSFTFFCAPPINNPHASSFYRNAGCKSVADKIRGKSPEEIRATFGIVNDFTPEEEVCTRQALAD